MARTCFRGCGRCAEPDAGAGSRRTTRPTTPGPISGYFASSAMTSRRKSLRSRDGIGRAASFTAAISESESESGMGPSPKLRGPRQAVSGPQAQPRKAIVRIGFGIRHARSPKFHERGAVGRPVPAHFAGNEFPHVGLATIAITVVILHGICGHTAQQFVPLVRAEVARQWKSIAS